MEVTGPYSFLHKINGTLSDKTTNEGFITEP